MADAENVRAREKEPPPLSNYEMAIRRHREIAERNRTGRVVCKLDEVPQEIKDTFDKLGIPLSEQKRLSNVAVDAVFDAMRLSMQRGDRIELRGFGVFQVRDKRARMGRNPKTGVPAAINPRRVISFRASQIMKSRVHDAHLAV